MERLKIHNATTGGTFYVLARAHRQHHPNSTIIVGCSKAGAVKIRAALAAGDNLRQADGPYTPKINGVEA